MTKKLFRGLVTHFRNQEAKGEITISANFWRGTSGSERSFQLAAADREQISHPAGCASPPCLLGEVLPSLPLTFRANPIAGSIPRRIWTESGPLSPSWRKSISRPPECACAWGSSSPPPWKASGGAWPEPQESEEGLLLNRQGRPGYPASGPIPLHPGRSQRPPARPGGFPCRDRAGPPGPPPPATGAGGRTFPPGGP